MQSGETIRIQGERFGQDLQGNIATKLAVTGTVDFPHAANADGRKDLVRSEASTGTEGHQYSEMVARIVALAGPFAVGQTSDCPKDDAPSGLHAKRGESP